MQAGTYTRYTLLYSNLFIQYWLEVKELIMTCPGKYMVKREQILIWKSNYIPFLHTVESIAESLELIYTLPLSRVFTG
jgi:hypothetical protein